MNTAESLINRERLVMPRDAAWLLESAQAVADRANKGTLRMSLVNDVLAHAETLKRRLQDIETLEKTL